MKTITIQIGNSDDKLTQKQWSEYVRDVWTYLNSEVVYIHFSGGSSNWELWQNYCWVINCDDVVLEFLKITLSKVAKKYRQESIAWTEGETEFI